MRDIFKIVIAILIVVGIIGLVFFLYQKFGGMNDGGDGVNEMEKKIEHTIDDKGKLKHGWLEYLTQYESEKYDGFDFILKHSQFLKSGDLKDVNDKLLHDLNLKHLKSVKLQMVHQ